MTARLRASGALLMKYALAAATLAAVSALLVMLRAHANLATVCLVLVLVVMGTAIVLGSGPALLNAVLATFTLNYFFIPPIYTLTIRDPANWVAFSVFVLCAVAVGQLSSRAKKTASEAESRRIQIEKLYEELKVAFADASEAEALRHSERLKSALLEAVTHDLRTPLTAIKASATTLLGSGTIGEDARVELLEVIDEEADRLNRFVEEMMELAQIEGGQLSLRRSPVPVLEVVNAALDRCAVPLQRHPVEVAIPQDLPALRVDAATISTVLVELLDNATKYSRPGTPIRVVAAKSDPANVEVAVEDRGVGVRAEVRERVFEKFYRDPNTKSRGFGMGLAIARGIVEAHGGRIWMEANPGGGSIFRFIVPGPETPA
jgi:two-component system sensor histidine kinase KdpD